MNKKHIILTIIIAGLLTAMLCIVHNGNKEKKDSQSAILAIQSLEDEPSEEFADTEEYDDSTMNLTIESPEFLNSIVKGASWSAELFCNVGGNTYYLAEDEHLFTTVLFTGEKVLVEDPSFFYTQQGTAKPEFLISVGEKSVLVDFSDPNSVKQLSALNFTPLPGFKRQRWSNVADFNDRVACPLEIDYPTSSVPNSQYISHWISTVALAQTTKPIRVAVSRPTYFTTTWSNRSGYKGSIDNRDAINEYISGKYFNDIKTEWGTDPDNYPSALYSCLSLRARYYTDHYVTYQLAISGYGGGAHGWSTVELVSYDHANHQEIDWKYLFKPGSEEQVLKLFAKAAETDEEYQYFSANFWDGVQLTDDDGKPTGEMLLPQPTLTPAGVTVSFQPYSLAGYTAGCFHLTVPYSRLKSYFTDRAKQCIGLK